MMEAISLVIVEDDAMVLDVNKQFIGRLPEFKILGCAKTGYEAKKLIEEHRPQLVLLDFYLPDMTGLDLIQYIRTNNIDIDFILVTAARDVETIQQIFRYGAIDYIIKPFRFDRLKASLLRYKQMINMMVKKDELEQTDLDKLSIKLEGSNQENNLPKGLNEVTLKQVLNFMIKGNKPFSSEEVANGTGLSRVTVRRYLEYLEKTKRLRLEVQYGSVGRPINRYTI